MRVIFRTAALFECALMDRIFQLGLETGTDIRL